jgi:hypothetical protein
LAHGSVMNRPELIRPRAGSRNQCRDRSWVHASAGTKAKTPSGNEREHSGKPEVRALLPPSATGGERAHRLSTPFVSRPLCPDRREGGDEQWCGHQPARHLSPKRGSPVLVDHHAAHAMQVAIGNGQRGVQNAAGSLASTEQRSARRGPRAPSRPVRLRRRTGSRRPTEARLPGPTVAMLKVGFGSRKIAAEPVTPPVAFTYDRYGHLFPEVDSRAARKLHALRQGGLTRSEEARSLPAIIPVRDCLPRREVVPPFRDS